MQDSQMKSFSIYFALEQKLDNKFRFDKRQRAKKHDTVKNSIKINTTIIIKKVKTLKNLNVTHEKQRMSLNNNIESVEEISQLTVGSIDSGKK